MHVTAAVISFAAVLVYAERSGWLAVQGGQTRWATTTRLGVGLVLTTVAVGFVDLAISQAPFLWRHWLVMAAMSLTVAGHLGLRGNSPT